MKKMIATVIATSLVILLRWAYKAIQPPPPAICGTPKGPPVTSKRIQLKDGRFLAYKETGTPKDKAKHKIIIVHGFGGSKDVYLPASQELIEELGIYFLSFDRAGYGDSDPYPKRSVRSEAKDIEELADQLEIGSKFYLIGISMGGCFTWSCLNYIPHRLAGAALVVPVVNYWWPSLPPELVNQAYSKMLVEDQRSLWIAHHVPFLLYFWMTQKWLPTLAVARGSLEVMSDQDIEIMQKLKAEQEPPVDKSVQQGVFESLHRDLIVGFGSWEFDPMNISNPFPNNEGSVHIWQGYNDKLVPVELQRYVAQKLPWINYHENPEGGHMFMLLEDWSNAILKALLQGQRTAASYINRLAIFICD